MSRLYDAQHWLDRAHEMREIAKSLGPLERAKEAMLRIAEEYDRRAARAAKRINGKDQAG